MGSANDFQFKTTDGSEFTAACLKTAGIRRTKSILLKYDDGPARRPSKIKMRFRRSIVLTGAWCADTICAHDTGRQVVWSRGLLGSVWVDLISGRCQMVESVVGRDSTGAVRSCPADARAVDFAAILRRHSASRSLYALALGVGEIEEWFGATWIFAKQILLCCSLPCLGGLFSTGPTGP
jgi:hypothetical protein